MMKRMSALIAIFTLSLLGSSCAPPEEKAPKTELATDVEKLSYVIGLDIGRSLKNQETNIDLQVLYQAIEDTLEGREPLVTQEEASNIKNEHTKRIREAHTQKAKAVGEKNKTEGEAFLIENGKKEGVITTESGMQYMILTQGDGPKPKETDQVRVNYQGTLIDGTEFDSSYKRGKPITFGLNRVIRGWTEGLQLMPVGSKFRFFIPSDLAYGERGAGANIGANATLIFEVELLEIVGAPEAKTESPSKE